MKKITYILITLIIAFVLSSCSNTADNPATTAQTTLATTTALTTTAQNSTTKATTTKATTTTQKATSATTKATTKAVSQTTTTQKTTAKTTKPTTKATTKATTTTAKMYCSITVECSSILKNMSDLKAGHESFVPSDGVIISTSDVEFKDGDTVYDVLKTACSANSVKLNVTSSAYGKYIAGIGNIDEKDCGAQSGWTYTVNGVSPPKSCDKYTLQKGDKIIFSYICNY